MHGPPREEGGSREFFLGRHDCHLRVRDLADTSRRPHLRVSNAQERPHLLPDADERCVLCVEQFQPEHDSEGCGLVEGEVDIGLPDRLELRDWIGGSLCMRLLDSFDHAFVGPDRDRRYNGALVGEVTEYGWRRDACDLCGYAKTDTFWTPRCELTLDRIKDRRAQVAVMIRPVRSSLRSSCNH